MKKIIAIALLTMFGLVGKSQAVQVSKSISSTTFVNGFAASDVLLLRANESMNYTLSGGATGTIHLEKTIDGTNWNIILSSTNNSSTGRRTGTEFSGDKDTMYRWRASTMTGAGSFSVILQDNDDFVGELRNRKGIPAVTFTDERVLLPRLNLVPANGDTPVSFSATTRFEDYDFPGSYAVVTSSGGAILLTATPTISTATARTGDIFIIHSTTATITVQDDGTLAGSALELGASTRALGVGDILVLIYRAGKWWELFLGNN